MKLSILYKLAVLTPALMFAIPEVGYCAESEKIITCPPKVVCSRDKSISSCSAVGENLEYWGKINASAPIKKGTFFFHRALASYQDSGEDGMSGLAMCIYNLSDSTQESASTSVHLDAKQESYLEAFLNPSTHQWSLYGYAAHCNNDGRATPEDPSLCPLAEIPSLNIKLDTQTFASLDMYANGILVNKNPMYSGGMLHMLTMYQAWDACSDSGLCLIHLTIKEGAGTSEIGSILVDMSDKMKIQFIYPSCGAGYTISSKSETPNLIEIKGL